MAHTKSYTLKYMYKQKAQYEHSHSGMLANTHAPTQGERLRVPLSREARGQILGSAFGSLDASVGGDFQSDEGRAEPEDKHRGNRTERESYLMICADCWHACQSLINYLHHHLTPEWFGKWFGFQSFACSVKTVVSLCFCACPASAFSSAFFCFNNTISSFREIMHSANSHNTNPPVEITTSDAYWVDALCMIDSK